MRWARSFDDSDGVTPYQIEAQGSGMESEWATTALPRRGGDTAVKNMLEAISKLKPPPCHGCSYKKRCATDELICGDYAGYIRINQFQKAKASGRPIDKIPTRTLYERRYNDNKDYVSGNPKPPKIPGWNIKENEFTGIYRLKRLDNKKAPYQYFASYEECVLCGIVPYVMGQR